MNLSLGDITNGILSGKDCVNIVISYNAKLKTVISSRFAIVNIKKGKCVGSARAMVFNDKFDAKKPYVPTMPKSPYGG